MRFDRGSGEGRSGAFGPVPGPAPTTSSVSVPDPVGERQGSGVPTGVDEPVAELLDGDLEILDLVEAEIDCSGEACRSESRDSHQLGTCRENEVYFLGQVVHILSGRRRPSGR